MNLEINGATYMTTNDAANHLGLSSGTLRNQRLRRREIVPSVTFAGRVLYLVDAVKAAKAAGTARPRARHIDPAGVG